MLVLFDSDRCGGEKGNNLSMFFFAFWDMLFLPCVIDCSLIKWLKLGNVNIKSTRQIKLIGKLIFFTAVIFTLSQCLIITLPFSEHFEHNWNFQIYVIFTMVFAMQTSMKAFDAL